MQYGKYIQMLKKIKEKIQPQRDDEKALYGSLAFFPAVMLESILHEFGHFGAAKALGYDPHMNFEIENGFMKGTTTTLDLQSGLNALLIDGAGPFVSNLLVLLSFLAFRKSKNPYVKGATGAYALIGGFHNTLNAILGMDYINMADEIEYMGFGRVGDTLQLIPAASAIAYSYLIGKEVWNQYATKTQTEE